MPVNEVRGSLLVAGMAHPAESGVQTGREAVPLAWSCRWQSALILCNLEVAYGE